MTEVVILTLGEHQDSCSGSDDEAPQGRDHLCLHGAGSKRRKWKVEMLVRGTEELGWSLFPAGITQTLPSMLLE